MRARACLHTHLAEPTQGFPAHADHAGRGDGCFPSSLHSVCLFNLYRNNTEENVQQKLLGAQRRCVVCPTRACTGCPREVWGGRRRRSCHCRALLHQHMKLANECQEGTLDLQMRFLLLIFLHDLSMKTDANRCKISSFPLEFG